MIPPSIIVVLILASLAQKSQQDMIEPIPASLQRLPSMVQPPSIAAPNVAQQPSRCSCTKGLMDSGRDYAKSAMELERAIMDAAKGSMNNNNNAEARRVLGIADQARNLQYDMAMPVNSTPGALQDQYRKISDFHKSLDDQFLRYPKSVQNRIGTARDNSANQLENLMREMRFMQEDGIGQPDVLKAASRGMRSALGDPQSTLCKNT